MGQCWSDTQTQNYNTHLVDEGCSRKNDLVDGRELYTHPELRHNKNIKWMEMKKMTLDGTVRLDKRIKNYRKKYQEK
jgi:hypothetical protein